MNSIPISFVVRKTNFSKGGQDGFVEMPKKIFYGKGATKNFHFEKNDWCHTIGCGCLSPDKNL